MSGAVYEGAIYDEIYDELLIDNAKLWLDIKGRACLDPRVVYRHGEVCVEVRTKYKRDVPQNVRYAYFVWVAAEYPVTDVPTDKRKRGDMLRNIAIMHAMKLGVPHRLRSKKL